MAITNLPTPPSRSNTPANFIINADAFVAALPTFVTEANSTAAAMNLNATNDTSASSVLIGTGTKTFTVSASKSFQPGMYLVIASTAAPSTNSMNVQVTSYSGTTLIVNSISVTGSGTIASWTISQSANFIPADLSITNAKLAQAYINDLTTVTFDSAADFVAIADASDGFNKKKALLPTVSDKIQPITATLAANALTLTLNPTTLDFRSTTLGSGTVTTVSNAANVSTVISSGSTAGATSAVLSRIVVLAINNAGTMELAWVNQAGGTNLDETGVITTVAEGGAGAAGSISTIYSTTARTGVAYRVVGYVDSTQATAGTWATAPSLIQGAGGEALKHIGAILNGTTIATTSGTSHDFTGIPSWVKRITLMFNGISTNGTSSFKVQFGDSGGIETTGYISGVTTGIELQNIGAAVIHSGSLSITLSNFAQNLWSANGNMGSANGSTSFGGSKSLSASLDRIRLTTGNGIDTFDAGSINILYE